MNTTNRATPLHRPLLALAVLMTLTLLGAAIAMILDPREVLGQSTWAKPVKFSASIAIYSLTLAWLIRLAPWRVTWWLGTVIAAMLLVEMVVITGAAVTATRSHFNVSTPLHSALWSIMGTSIAIVWILTAVIAGYLLRADLGDRARTVAIRWGLVIGLIGMALAFLMTMPTESQLQDFEGIAGAHTVGMPDGGAGLPVLGWSTEAGDLRIPHFVGMHGLQVIPLAALALERIRSQWSVDLRRRLVHIVALGYLAVVGVVTWQALRGQPLTGPDALTLGAVGVVAMAAATATVATLRTAHTRPAADAALAEKP